VQWQALHECVWRGEAWLTQVVPLETYYPNNSALFRNYLNIPNSNVGHIIEEAALIKHGHTMAHIEKILLALASHAKVARPNLTQLERLKTTLRMFPVAVSSTTDKPYEYLATVGDTKQWLIADRAIFREQFRDILPILVLSVENVLKIREFLYLLDLKNRFLSERATTITEAHGNVELDGRLTDRYRSRGDFFFRFVSSVASGESLRSRWANRRQTHSGIAARSEPVAGKIPPGRGLHLLERRAVLARQRRPRFGPEHAGGRHRVLGKRLRRGPPNLYAQRLRARDTSGRAGNSTTPVFQHRPRAWRSSERRVDRERPAAERAL